MWSEFTMTNFKFLINDNNIIINEEFIDKIKNIRKEIKESNDIE